MSANSGTGPIGPIQVVPAGLTGVLQLKQTGRLPTALADLVAPVFELRDWYLMSRRLTEQALFPGGAPSAISVTTATGPGTYTFNAGAAVCAVPQTQVWWIDQFTIQIVASAAADLWRIAGGISPGAGNLEITNTESVMDTAVARVRQGASANLQRGFWALPGDQFVAHVQDVVSAAGLSVNLRLRATPCPL